jgi:geranylgeranyl pyrophosphate synthase
MNVNMDMEFIDTYVNLFEDTYKAYIGERKPRTLYGPIFDLLERGGKRLRPSLCLMCCQLVGGNIKKAIPTAVCIELFHNFSLIHDDIEDDSKLRRGKPALHLIYGIPIALNAGDGLHALCYGVLKENKKALGIDKAWKIYERMTEMSIELVEGQAMDLEFKERVAKKKEKKNEMKQIIMSEYEVIEMITKKTGELFAAAAECGAIAGTASYEMARQLGDAWRDIGIAFQIQDDILNIVGEEEKYGKRVGEDIVEGKPTLLLSHCLYHCKPDEKEKVYDNLDTNEYERRKIEEVIGLFKMYHSIDYSKEKAREYLRRGIDNLPKIGNKNKTRGKETVGIEEEIREKMVALAEYFVARER